MKFRLTPVAAALTAMFAVPAFAADEAPAAAAPVAEAAAPAAAAASSAEPKVQLPAVKVTGQAPSPYKPVQPASPKYTEPLRNIPQTIQVIPAKVIEDQNQLTLRDMLGNVPGITFGAAEGGNGFGDNITFRGARIDSDIFVDGIRDAAQTARVDPFNLEQLEVTKGASSVYSGAGAVSGTINMVSKTAKNDEFNKADLGVGVDGYFRTTVDSNQRINDTTALRLNAMSHQNDSPGRDEVSAERWGIAGSLAFGLGTANRATLNVLHQDNERVPDRGLLWRRATATSQGQPVPSDREVYFGWSNTDREESTVDTITATFERDISDKVSLQNITRYTSNDNYSSLATINGLVCIAGVPFNSPGSTCPAPLTPGGSTFTMTGNPGNVRDDATALTTNVTNLTWRFDTAGISHTLVTGLAVTREDFDRVSKQARNPDGTALPAAAFVRDLNNPDTVFDLPFILVQTGTNGSEINNQSVYAFDTAKIGSQIEVTAGLRYERNEAVYTAQTTTATTELESNDNLLSGRVGLVFKPTDKGSVYVAYGNSLSPSGSSVTSSCSNTATSQNCNVDPEKTISYEIGTKWDVLGDKLFLAASIFRNDRTNTRVANADPQNPVQVLDGESRVQGLELSANGQITKEWSISANYAFLDSEILSSQANNTAPNVADAQAGNDIPATPDNSGSLWTTYAFPFGLELGYGARYVGEYKTDGTDTATTVPDYWVQNALVGYRVDRNLNLRLNINNLTDELYWTSVRPQGWGYPGEGRTFVLTASYNF